MKPMPRAWPGAALLRVLLVVLSIAVACTAPAAAEADASVTARRFYGWYLAALAANREPLRDDPGGFSARVSASLMREIRQKLESPDGMEADYFIQAQDYAEDWIDHVAAAPAQGNAARAVVAVVLGVEPSTLQRLNVVLTKEDGAWKIRRVSAR